MNFLWKVVYSLTNLISYLNHSQGIISQVASNIQICIDFLFFEDLIYYEHMGIQVAHPVQITYLVDVAYTPSFCNTEDEIRFKPIYGLKHIASHEYIISHFENTYKVGSGNVLSSLRKLPFSNLIPPSLFEIFPTHLHLTHFPN